MPHIPPIHNNNNITDFKEKVEIFYNFFAEQCPMVTNTSKLNIDSLKRKNNCFSMISFT